MSGVWVGGGAEGLVVDLRWQVQDQALLAVTTGVGARRGIAASDPQLDLSQAVMTVVAPDASSRAAATDDQYPPTPCSWHRSGPSGPRDAVAQGFLAEMAYVNRY